jgi:hypothetical protein
MILKMGGFRVGKPLENAHQNAECRESDKFTNQRVFESQRGDRVQRSKPRGRVRLGRKDQQQRKKQRGAIRTYLNEVAGRQRDFGGRVFRGEPLPPIDLRLHSPGLSHAFESVAQNTVTQ